MKPLAITALALAALAGCSSNPGAGGEDAEPAPATAQVEVQEMLLFPAEVTVAVGGQVTWTNMDTIKHHLVDGSPGGANLGQIFDSDVLLAPDGFVPYSQFTVTFSAAGEVPYHCVDHPEITVGKVIVR